MDDKILKFMAEENARLSNGNKWMTVDSTLVITVWVRLYGAKRTASVYRGFSVDDALEALGIEN